MDNNGIFFGALNSLDERITNLSNIGRYLSNWNATTGLPTTNPTSMPYTYKAGDYFIVSTVGATNYIPSGSSYNGTASTTTTTAVIKQGDMFFYDGTSWVLLVTGSPNQVTINVTYTDGTTGTLIVDGTLV